MELPNPGKLPKKDLAEFARRIQQFLYLDTTEPHDGKSIEFWNNKKVTDGSTIQRYLDDLLSEFDLLEPIGGEYCQICRELCDEKAAHKVDDGFVCHDCWDERLRQ